MLYELADKPPPPNSFQEYVFLTLWFMREDRELRQTLLHAHVTMAAGSEDPKGVEKTLEEYFEARFPFSKKEKQKRDEKVRAYLEQMSTKAFKISPLPRGRRK